MRNLALRAVVLGVVAACGASGTSWAQRSVQADATKIMALENAWGRASETGDANSISTLLDDTYVYVDVDGRLMTKAEVLKEVKDAGEVQVVTESMVARVHGDTAVVAGRFRMKRMVGGKLFLQRGYFVDTWLYQHGGWVCIASEATPARQ